MLSKAMVKPESKQIAFMLAEVTHLPFRNDSFDAIIISFATRNINTSRSNLIKALQEFHRILRAGGIYVNLETSQPKSGILRRLFHLYVKLAVRPVGRLVSGSDVAYTSLSHTMRRFYNAENLAQIIREAGFAEINLEIGSLEWRPFTRLENILWYSSQIQTPCHVEKNRERPVKAQHNMSANQSTHNSNQDSPGNINRVMNPNVYPSKGPQCH